MNNPSLIECSFEQQGAAIQAIFNQVILTSTALYEYEPRSLDSIADWFAAKQRGQYPVLGYVDAENRLLGFTSYGPFRDKPANRFTLEHAVYVADQAQGQGIGRQLLLALLARARAEGYHTLIAAIDAENQPSIRLHERLGFQQGGRLRQVAYKFDRWLDLSFYQRMLQDVP